MKIKSFKIIFSIVIFLSFFPPLSVNAQDAHPQLRYNLKLDIVVTAITAAGFLGTAAFEKQLAPSSCRWCEVNGFDDWGHRNLAWSNTKAADITSHVTVFALAPMVAFGLQALAASYDNRLDEFPIDALVIAEAVSSAAMLTQIFKFSTGRQRPSAHYALNPGSDSRDNTSFYSGHTSIAFALAVSSGTVASMREYRLAPLIWGSGLAVAVTSGFLRLAADKHYLTDVIAGSVIGSAIGFCLPYFLHRSNKPNAPNVMVSVAQIDGGGIMSLQGTF
ncbi:MAG: phosphatase PAP2 family protein [Pseudomonadota bacterium]